MRDLSRWSGIRRRKSAPANTAQLSLDFSATKAALEKSEHHLAMVRAQAKESEKKARDLEAHNLRLQAELRAILANDNVVRLLNSDARETPRKKRGRPSNAELAARTAARLNSKGRFNG